MELTRCRHDCLSSVSQMRFLPGMIRFYAVKSLPYLVVDAVLEQRVHIYADALAVVFRARQEQT